MTVSLTYAQTLRLLASVHSVSDAKLVAFRGRLQHFQRLGFPPGVNTGRGRAAIYGPAELMNLLVAFEMLQLGMTPERIKRVLTLDQPMVIIAAAFGAMGVLDKVEPRKHLLLCVDPVALSALIESSEPDDPSSRSLFYMDGGSLARSVAERGMAGTRVCAINCTLLLKQVAIILEEAGIIDSSSFLAAILAWTQSFDWDVFQVDPGA